MQHNSGVWEVEISKTGNAASAKELLQVHALSIALNEIGNGECPSRVKAAVLIRTTKKHLKGIYAEVRGDGEGCNLLRGRGPKCDILYDSERDQGVEGLICGDCGSKTEECEAAPDPDKCSKCGSRVDATTNQTVTCTQQQCRSKGKTACRTCCVHSFETNHYHQHAYQPKGFEPVKWQGLTVSEWQNKQEKSKGISTPQNLGGEAEHVHMIPTTNTPATTNNVLATTDGTDGNTPRATQYLGMLDKRHALAAGMGYDPEWKPPKSIETQYSHKRKILGECTGMIKAMAEVHKKLSKYGGDENEYTRNGFDIHLKMRVRCDTGSTQYAVSMCWLCMPIREDKVIWDADNFPAEHEDMKMEKDGQKIDVVSKNDRRYQFNGQLVCKASGHTGLGMCCTVESFRGKKDWLTDARRDPEFNKGLPGKVRGSKKLHSAEAHEVFMKFTLNLFPALASPMAYPEGGDAGAYQRVVRGALGEEVERGRAI